MQCLTFPLLKRNLGRKENTVFQKTWHVDEHLQNRLFMSEIKLGWTCAHPPIYIPIYVTKRFSDQKRQVFPLFLLRYRKEVAKKVNIRVEKSGSIRDTFLKSQFAPALVCILGAVFKFQVPVKSFREKSWDFTSFGACALPNCSSLTNDRSGTDSWIYRSGFESAFTSATSQSLVVVWFRLVCDPSVRREHTLLWKEDVN